MPTLPHSLTFRLTLIYLGLFTASVAVLLGVLYWLGVVAPLREVRVALAEEATALMESYAGKDDLDALARKLAARPALPHDRYPFHALIGPDGDLVTANIPYWPAPSPGAWLRFELADFGASMDDEHEILARDLALPGGARLLLGRDTEDVDEREELIAQASSWGTGATLLLGMAGGILMSRAVARRIEQIHRTARRVMHGDLSGRIRISGGNDDFAHLSETLNEMLDRIEASVQSVGRVSDSIAHEMRTPLTRLRADLENLVEAADGKATQARAERALGEAARLQTTFEALLGIARVETRRHRLSPLQLDVEELLRDAAELYEIAAEDREQKLLISVVPALTAIGDRNLIFQAVANLLDNAIKYGPRRSAITVEALATDGIVTLAVQDEGPGIPDTEIGRVTERFYRLSDDDNAPGLGLGLPLVAAVMAAHDGELRLSNRAPGLRAEMRLPAGPRSNG
jgi:signal transduction histidine kinase